MQHFFVVLIATVLSAFAMAPVPATAAQETTQPAPSARPDLTAIEYAARAREVMRDIQTRFYLRDAGLYAHSMKERKPDFMWGNGVMFTALVGAARHEPATYLPVMNRFFHALDRYWDTHAANPGYEPSPTSGGGHDKYFDDNAWMVLTYTEAYELTHDQQYLDRAQQTLTFVLTGCDEQLGGGIWWHETHKGGTKNTCVNAPAAVACLRVAGHLPPAKSAATVDTARRLVDWTNQHLRTGDGLFADSINVTTGSVNRAKLTYNAALMIRANLALYRRLQDQQYLDEAKRIASASDWFMDKRTQAYRDPVKWSHLLVEADLEMYRATHDNRWMQRAASNADYEYRTWIQKPPEELIDAASIARTLWLMADMQSPLGSRFWEQVKQREGPAQQGR
jgi:hypothetical protein